MKQYYAIKGKYPDALLLFRVGDFYEMFGEDAIKASKILSITLTKRANGAAAYIELAGFPHHSIDNYLPKLVRAGQRVAICDQLEDPKLTKNIVKRGVTELVTPGVSINDNILQNDSNNFLASVYVRGERCGVAFVDISTGEFLVAQGKEEYVAKLLQGFQPSEVLHERSKSKYFVEHFGSSFYTYSLDEWVYTLDFTQDLLLKHFETTSLKGFGLQDYEEGIIAAGAALHYISETRQEKLKHITNIARIEEELYVWLDRFTVRNLELFGSNNEGATTLFDIINKTVSPMGARLLKRWLALPLKELHPITERLDLVEYFIQHDVEKNALIQNLKQIGDIERLLSKIALGKINPREAVQLRRGLEQIAPIKQLALASNLKPLRKIGDQLNTCHELIERITTQLMEDPPVLVSKGGVVRNGFSEELDELRMLLTSGKDYLIDLQQRELAKTGITSLKIGFNNVFGYYLEVTNSHKDKVPEDWIRKQTLVNAERYITPELKDYESKILGAEEKILALESKIFSELIYSLNDYIVPIQLNSALVARLDCLISFAEVGRINNYCKPTINDSFDLKITKGRHPVIEHKLALGEEYIPNDILLEKEEQQIVMITGPNMSGKSAILRQTALIVLMAQIGSFVPAESAEIGLIDKIFTRVGASDNLSAGESTFMVEMNETASILNNLSNRSLILLDEIGRGTSTYDGISIAWAIAEYIHDHPTQPKTLFATHYHELNEMAESHPRIRNFNVSVKELQNKVIFMRKLIPGGSAHSFGIHVAKMAGMPPKVLKKANEVLKQMEGNAGNENIQRNLKEVSAQKAMQLSIFQLDDPVLSQIKDELIKTDINTLTPVEALMKLNDIKKLVGK